MQKLKGSEEWKQTRQFFTNYDIWLLLGCEFGYMTMVDYNVMVKGIRCRERTGDKAVSTARTQALQQSHVFETCFFFQILMCALQYKS